MALRHMKVWRYVDEVARTGSIRKAAERLNVTASAVQRRIQDVEDDLGAEIFERSAQGMRLTAAGETFIRWIRAQAADLDRVQSQIEDLGGLRRGQVRVACSQALVQSFLPREIAAFRERFPLVSFQVSVRDHGLALKALGDFEADLALVFRPPKVADFQPLMTLGQRLVAIMPAGHPLASRDTVRLRDCAPYPVALPERSYGGRQIIDDVMAGGSTRLQIALESNSFEMLRNFVRLNDAVTFQIEIGADAGHEAEGLVARPIDDRDLAHGPLVLGQLRGRALPVAAAKFAEHLGRRLDAMRTTPQITSISAS
jgi:DNA-binding transcriptional LysR family regulator